MPTRLKAEDLAAQYGWSMSVLRAYPEVWRLFQSATAGGWSTDRFVAKLRDTKWFRSRSAVTRQMAVLKYADPQEYKRQVAARRAQIGDIAGQLGAQVPGAAMARITENAVVLGMNDAEIRNAMGIYINVQKSGHFAGQAGLDEAQLREFARSMGVGLTSSSLRTMVRNIATGATTIDSFKQNMRAQAERTYTAYAEDIRNGVSVMELAAPYIQSMGQILEVNPQALDPMDATIRKAMTRVDPASGKPTQVPVWQFETELRNDPRWLKTKNAQDSLMAAGHQVLNDFGMLT